MRRLLALLCLLLLPAVALAQTVPINGNLLVRGHINACITGPSGATDNPYSCTLGGTVTAYQTQACYRFVADVANTGAASVNFSSLGAKTIKKVTGGITTDLADNDIRTGQLVHVCYDGTNMQMVSPLGNAPAASGASQLYIPAGSMSVSGGCTANDPAALVTNGPQLPTITCTDADTASIEFDYVSSSSWGAGTITVTLYAFNTAAETTALRLHFAGQCVSSGDAPTAHSTTGEQAATITWTNATNREVAATTAAITLQGSCVAGDHVYIRGQVDATATTTANMATVKILGVKVE